MCKVAPFAAELSVNVSIFTLVAISLDRYHVILYPLKQKLRPKHCFIILFIIWVVSFLLSSVHLINFKIEMGTFCKINITFEKPQCNVLNFDLYKYHKLSLVVIQYLIPFLLICFTYLRIGYHIYFGIDINTVNKKQEENKKKVT